MCKNVLTAAAQYLTGAPAPRSRRAMALWQNLHRALLEVTTATPTLVEKARELYANDSDDDIEIDDEPLTSVGEDGTWVQAWVWVRKEDCSDA